MELTHLGHSCVLVDTGSARLLFDPGTFSHGFEQLSGLDAVLITHQHPDHLDPARLPVVLASNPEAVLLVDEGSAVEVAQLGLAFRTVRPGEAASVAGARIAVVGGAHAVIHPDIPGIANNGYVIDDGAFYHPGDSLVVPPQDVDVVAVAIGAPWLKISEAVDFVRSLAPRVAVPVHDGFLSNSAIYEGLLRTLAPPTTTVQVMASGSAATL